MNFLYACKVNEFWVNVAKTLQKKYDFTPVYWVGYEQGSEVPTGCYFYCVWKAFSLETSSSKRRLDIDIFSRREYYNYLKILDRVDFDSNFRFSERDDLFKRQTEFWLEVLEDYSIDCVVFSNAPHLPYDYPLYLCAKKLGIKTVLFNVCSIPGWHYITHSIGGHPKGLIDRDLVDRKSEAFFEEAVRPFQWAYYKTPRYMALQEKQNAAVKNRIKTNQFLSMPAHLFSAAFRFVTKRQTFRQAFYSERKLSTLKTRSGPYVFRKVSVFEASSLTVRAEKARKKIRKEYESLSEDFDARANYQSYYYFPVHYQPELTTTPLGGDASDQFYLIRELSKALPVGKKLVVKEHPSQFAVGLHGHQGRDIGAWKRISKLSNVVLCNLNQSSKLLIENCLAVITVTGTAGWEAMVNGIPCIHFGNPWYQTFPQATKSDFEDLEFALLKVSEQVGKPACYIGNSDAEKYFEKYAIRNNIHCLEKLGVESNPDQAADLIVSAVDAQ